MTDEAAIEACKNKKCQQCQIDVQEQQQKRKRRRAREIKKGVCTQIFGLLGIWVNSKSNSYDNINVKLNANVNSAVERMPNQ